jgi:hypothetical protein
VIHPYQYFLDDALVGGGIFPTHFFGQKHPSFFDHFKRRSENTLHTFGNNKDLTLDLGGYFGRACFGISNWLFH